MTDDKTLPPGIGSHEGRELELMLKGEKPLAMFSDVVPASYEMPEADFAPYVDSGLIVRREEVYNSPTSTYPIRYVYFALRDETWRLEEIHGINEAIHTGRRKAAASDDERTGQLLGYSAEQISEFLERSES